VISPVIWLPHYSQAGALGARIALARFKLGRWWRSPAIMLGMEAMAVRALTACLLLRPE